MIAVCYRGCSEELYNNHVPLERMIELILLSQDECWIGAQQRSQIVQEDLTREEKRFFVQQELKINNKYALYRERA